MNTVADAGSGAQCQFRTAVPLQPLQGDHFLSGFVQSLLPHASPDPELMDRLRDVSLEADRHCWQFSMQVTD